MHDQPHVAEDPQFEPSDPQIQVFVRNETDMNVVGGRELSVEYDVFGCDAFVEDKGRWLRLMPDAEYIPT